MKKIITSNDKLLDILTDCGINVTCDENMDIFLTDEDARRIEDIIEEHAPAAEFDYTIEDYDACSWEEIREAIDTCFELKDLVENWR